MLSSGSRTFSELARKLDSLSYIDKSFFDPFDSKYKEYTLPLKLDNQGISWVNMEISRKEYRYFRNTMQAGARFRTPKAETLLLANKLYNFDRFYTKVDIYMEHFQSRFNIKAGSNHDVFMTSAQGFSHYNTINNVQKYYQFHEKMSSLDIGVHKNFVGCTSLDGDLALFDVDLNKTIIQKQITEGASCNDIKICDSPTGSIWVLIGANDSKIRIYDIMNLGEPLMELESKAPVNCVALGNNNTTLLTVGDHNDAELWDVRLKKRVYNLVGHRDHAFTADWGVNNPYQVATGSQDCTCRIWDIRQPTKKNIYEMVSEIGSIYCLKYSKNGNYLAFGEMMDYIHIYETATYNYQQEIDFFGQVSGIDFDPVGDSLFFGVRKEKNEGFFEYKPNSDKSNAMLLEECEL